jgi:hypothetical protein
MTLPLSSFACGREESTQNKRMNVGPHPNPLLMEREPHTAQKNKHSFDDLLVL